MFGEFLAQDMLMVSNKRSTLLRILAKEYSKARFLFAVI